MLTGKAYVIVWAAALKKVSIVLVSYSVHSVSQFGLELPRSTYEQQEMGKSVSRSNLRTGDLVLFRAGFNGTPCRYLYRQQSVCPCFHQQWCYYFQHE
ncbi:lipoprotein [Escherichia coli]|uniref:Lipoprotein n=1 Tax=Escherichia coli TaxID=562 RepID=A0A376KSU5_ECOLX|nr:lipoprotein [Escherichia coli]